MVDPLLERGILCFEGGVGGDVFRRCFGPNDFFRKQIEAKRKSKEEVKHEITQGSEEQVNRKTHSRMVRFLGALSSLGCLPLSMTLGFSLLDAGEKMRSDG
jgi:basic membrane lipoprotein Med (substrate-binding protein (PBP1-ABC) superfamily)